MLHWTIFSRFTLVLLYRVVFSVTISFGPNHTAENSLTSSELSSDLTTSITVGCSAISIHNTYGPDWNRTPQRHFVEQSALENSADDIRLLKTQTPFILHGKVSGSMYKHVKALVRFPLLSTPGYYLSIITQVCSI